MGNLVDSQPIDRNALRVTIKQSRLKKFYYKLDGQAEMRFDYINRSICDTQLSDLNSEIESIKRSISNTSDEYHLERLVFQHDSIMIANHIDETLDMLMVGTDDELQKSLCRCEDLINGSDEIISNDPLNIHLATNIMAYFDIKLPIIDRTTFGVPAIASALEIACYFGSSRVLKAILEYLEQAPSASVSVTKLVRFVCSGYTAQKSKNDSECIDLLLGNCIRELIHHPDEHNFSAIFYLRYRPETVLRLLINGAYIGAQYKDALPVVSYVHPKRLKDHLDACITREIGSNDNKVLQLRQHTSVESPIKYDLINFFSSERNEMATIKYIATADEYQHLLTHPLVELSVELKWRRFSFIFHSMLLLYIAFCIVTWRLFYYRNAVQRASGPLRTVTMIFNVFHLISQGCLHLLHRRTVMSFCCTIFYSLSFVATILSKPGPEITDFLIPGYRLIFGMIIAIFVFARALSLFSRHNQRIAHLLHHLSNLIQWKIKSMIFVTVSIQALDLDIHLYSIDYVICISLMTLELFNMTGSISWSFSKYYVMFRDVAWSSIKSLQLCVVLIPAFATMFFLSLEESAVKEDIVFNGYLNETELTQKSFASFASSVQNTFVMAIGEFNYNELEARLDDSLMGQCVFLAFLWFISVIFMNLMNGLAVGDTQRISATAQLVSLRQRVQLLFSYEEVYMSAVEKVNWLENHIYRLRSTTNHLVNTYAYLKIEKDICQIQWIRKYRVKHTNRNMTNVEDPADMTASKTFNFTCNRKLYDRTVLLVKNRQQQIENDKQAETEQRKEEERHSNMDRCLNDLHLSSQKTVIRLNKIEASLEQITDFLKQFQESKNQFNEQ